MLVDEAKRKDLDAKSKAQSNNKIINELKREVEALKIELRNHNTELSQK